MIKVIVAHNTGFCFGVKNAVEIAKNAAKLGEVYTYGNLVHNERVVDELEKMGIKTSSDLPFLLSKERVVISAHGVTPQVERRLRENVKNVYDATCPFVKKIHNIVKTHLENGYNIAVIGNPEHPEVKGILGYAGTEAVVVSDLSPFTYSGDKPLCVVVQTTFSMKKYNIIKQNIKNFMDNNIKSVEFFDTICYTTLARQNEAQTLSAECEAVLVIGSKSSSNTLRLVDIARNHTENVFLISTVDELNSIPFGNYNTLALLAAASAPQKLIKEVLFYMSDTQDAKIVSEATEQAAEVAAEQTASAEVSAAVEVAASEKSQPQKELSEMDKLMANNKNAGFINYKAGKRVNGKVISADENGIFVSIGGKKDGFIERSEAELDGVEFNPANYKINDEIEAVIIANKAKDSTYVALSKKEIDAKKAEDAKVLEVLNGSEFSLICNQVVKGGIIGKMGSYTIFVPASQIRMGYVKNLEDYTQKPLRLRALPPKPPKEGEEERKRNAKLIVASQRIILEEEKAAKEDAFWSSMQVGAIVQGKVKRFSTFGAFVSVKGFDCLAHISDLSHTRISSPDEVLTIGETYDFVVLKVDRETGKISLGFKQLQKPPYELAAEKYPVGTVIKGKVERIFPFGAFISIEKGIDGLVHVTQIARKFVKDPNDVLKVGDEVEAKIISFEDNKITLSMKELLPEEEAAPAVDNSYDEPETAAVKRTPRPRKNLDYAEVQQKAEENKQRRARREEHSSDPKEYISDSATATLADILGNIDFKKFESGDEENK